MLNLISAICPRSCKEPVFALRGILTLACVLLAACDDTRPKPEGTSVASQDDHEVAQAHAPPCEPPRFSPIGTAKLAALSRAALDSKTGQQCRTAENAAPAFRSLPMCRELLGQQRTSQSCGERFTPLGTALTRVALDTQTGQECRTAENAPPAFVSLPMCRDLK
jgi:hypothetical protein